MYIKTSEQDKLKLGFGGYSCNWGLHIAGLYETEERRDEIILGFLHEGDLQNELQLYCPVERTAADFTEKYSQKYPECKNHIHDPNIFRLSI